eukprot:6107934-Amphidinium_carterae.1
MATISTSGRVLWRQRRLYGGGTGGLIAMKHQHQDFARTNGKSSSCILKLLVSLPLLLLRTKSCAGDARASSSLCGMMPFLRAFAQEKINCHLSDRLAVDFSP